MLVRVNGQPHRLYTRDPHAPYMTSTASASCRLPSGHPEGYLEGFATIYTEAARAIRTAREGRKPDSEVLYPTVRDGLAGMQFIDAAVRSSANGNVWTKIA